MFGNKLFLNRNVINEYVLTGHVFAVIYALFRYFRYIGCVNIDYEPKVV